MTLVGGDTYHLKINKQPSQIPLEQAIFIVCIEDALGDAQKINKISNLLFFSKLKLQFHFCKWIHSDLSGNII